MADWSTPERQIPEGQRTQLCGGREENGEKEEGRSLVEGKKIARSGPLSKQAPADLPAERANSDYDCGNGKCHQCRHQNKQRYR